MAKYGCERYPETCDDHRPIGDTNMGDTRKLCDRCELEDKLRAKLDEVINDAKVVVAFRFKATELLRHWLEYSVSAGGRTPRTDLVVLRELHDKTCALLESEKAVAECPCAGRVVPRPAGLERCAVCGLMVPEE